jgi:hypothetical protein
MPHMLKIEHGMSWILKGFEMEWKKILNNF